MKVVKSIVEFIVIVSLIILAVHKHDSFYLIAALGVGIEMQLNTIIRLLKEER